MRLLLMGEHVLIMQGLVRLLEELPDVEIFPTIQQQAAEEAARGWGPEVLIAETPNVLAAAERLAGLRAAAPAIPLLVIAPSEREQFLAALRAGARGFVGRDATTEQLVGCIEAVRSGEWGLPRALLSVLAGAYVELATADDRLSAVTLAEREQRVLTLLVRGASTAEIGSELFLSQGTVRANIRSLTTKLGVANRVQLVAEALRRGLVSAG
jgi:DNA-binding NarL/FixJ family response regulator